MDNQRPALELKCFEDIRQCTNENGESVVMDTGDRL